MKGLVRGLDAYHVGQQTAMKRLVPGYHWPVAREIAVQRAVGLPDSTNEPRHPR
jgi:hypothetical protein